ncbi:glycerophosphodiester phosphodiesterase family protein [Nocardioides sp. LHG3406-4]|uniref:glycerophosphodiester phosphodiesterase family protein n=1 Tax=Nocardioides sp. LHG3406-4 TaxID=2804575 RepID=UPI003CE73517
MTLTQLAPSRGRETSLVVTPAVVAHRGASGHRPEHTLDAYRTAIRMGVDDIELDVVATRDGVLVARHENEIGGTTDVADHPRFADRRTTRMIDGESLTGWFTEDFTLDELKQLTARERLPKLRSANTSYDGREAVPTLSEVLAMVQAESVRRGRGVGVMVELKHASYFDMLGLPLDVPLLADLAHHGLDHPRSRVSVMAFETTILRRLATECRLPLIQLVGARRERPADLVAVGDRRTYADLVTPEGLGWVDEYADGLGVMKGLVLPRDATGRTGSPSNLVRDAHRHWLTVHVWTLRAENAYLPVNFRGPGRPRQHGDLAAEARAHLAAGVDGLITDHPDQVIPVVGDLAHM